MRVVDSSGWIEYFAQGENADLFIPPIRDLEHLIVPIICTYDVLKCLIAGRDEDSALLAVGSCHTGARWDWIGVWRLKPSKSSAIINRRWQTESSLPLPDELKPPFGRRMSTSRVCPTPGALRRIEHGFYLSRYHSGSLELLQRSARRAASVGGEGGQVCSAGGVGAKLTVETGCVDVRVRGDVVIKIP